MVITLIGFSGCGKSLLAQKFSALSDWSVIDCDALIEERLEGELPPGEHGTRRVAAWLGQPYTADFETRQKQYFTAEQTVMQNILEKLETKCLQTNAQSQEHLLIDATGSVIYLEEKLLVKLKQLSTIVHLHVPETERQAMFERYLADPKPVLWQGLFQPVLGEENAEALKRCYPLLLTERQKRYFSLCHISVQAPVVQKHISSAEEFLETVRTTRMEGKEVS